MNRFLVAWLPAEERGAVLPIAFAGVFVGWAAQFLSQMAEAQPALQEALVAVPYAAVLVIGLITFAVAFVLTWALIAFLRVPRALGLYLVGSQLAAAAGALIGLPIELSLAGGAGAAALSTLGSPFALASAVGMVLGAPGGAWIVDTVTLAKIRAGVDEEPVPAKPVTRERWAFLGIDGRPLQGAAQVAWALVLYAIVVEGVAVVQNAAFTAVVSGAADATLANPVIGSMNYIIPIVGILAVALAAFVATSRTGVRSVWVSSAASTAVTGLQSLLFLPQIWSLGTTAVVGQLLWIPFGLLAIGLAIAGSALALRRRAARLSQHV